MAFPLGRLMVTITMAAASTKQTIAMTPMGSLSLVFMVSVPLLWNDAGIASQWAPRRGAHEDEDLFKASL